MVDPKFASPTSDIAEPRRLKLRRDMDEPIRAQSINDKDEPKMPSPNMDNEDPMRVNLPHDIELAKRACSCMSTEEARRAMPATAMWHPNLQ